MRRFVFPAQLCACASFPVMAQGVDPLEARVETADVDRFAALWEEAGGPPDADTLQTRYIDEGGDAIAIFTPGRIENGAWLARTVAANEALYNDALTRCRPWLSNTDDELRATYLALSGLFPDAQLPRIAVVMGANNSGGTAGRGMQVLGLEVVCRMSPDEGAFRNSMRHLFAHETVHTLQDVDYRAMDAATQGLANILAEGGADYIAWLATGRDNAPDRTAWAEANADMVWREFAADVARISQPGLSESDHLAIARRWVGNAGSPPPGWPSELGYWVGMQIARGYVEQSADKRVALRELLRIDDPMAIVMRSGYAPRIFGAGGAAAN